MKRFITKLRLKLCQTHKDSRKNWFIAFSFLCSICSFFLFELRYHELPWEEELRGSLDRGEDIRMIICILNLPVYLSQIAAVLASILSIYAIKCDAKWIGAIMLILSLLAFMNAIVID
jgi:hypothetical protein